MLQRWIGPWATLAVLASAVHAQDAAPVLVEMRVVAAAPRRATVDRGALDGLEVGDRVTFRLRDGGERTGRVVELSERTAVVEPTDAAFVAIAGMRVEARLPAARFELVEEVIEEPLTPEPAAEGVELPERPPWQRPDDGWTDSMPLLAKVRPFRPEERERQLVGRAWTSLDHFASTEGDRSDTLVRVGFDAELLNPFSQGGRLALDVEWNRRETDVPDDDDDSRSDLRLDRLSYAWGGHRFARDRIEIGRFLHSEFPEFGVIDGVEWSRRLGGGGSLGASLGFMPEWDTLDEEGRDQEVAAWYLWAADESEVLALGAGYQKTFRDLDADRDLVVLKAAYLPLRAWTAQATAWVDFYSAGDDPKASGPELTQAWFTTGRAWEGGHSLDLSYRHLAFALTDRQEFLPVAQAQLADDRYDRAAVTARQRFGHVGLREEAGVWSDEDEEGFDAELAFLVDDLLYDGALFEAAGFVTQGRFTELAGWRAALGGRGGVATWRLGYEFVVNRYEGFSADNDDLPHHRATGDLDWFTASGWSLTLHGETLLYDQETGWAASLYLQRSF
ncbi:MAG: hypothetical protein JNK02_16855 [Planctomycetes bacterium]|nr:hypothetical protein [Planctomycetota bacterium]